MSIQEGLLGLLGLVDAFYDDVKDEAVAYVRALPSWESMGKVKPRGIFKLPSRSFIASTSIPRGILFQRQLCSTVIRRGNHEDSERICT